MGRKRRKGGNKAKARTGGAGERIKKGKGKSNNNRNKDNTSQPRPGFTCPVGKKGTENATTENTTSDEDTEDDNSNDIDFPPNEIDVSTVGGIEENDDEEQDYVKESSTNEKSPANKSNMLLSEEEKEQILNLSKQNTLEEAISYTLRHMERRCEEAGEVVQPLTTLEKMAYRFRDAYDNPTSKSASSSQAQQVDMTSTGSSTSSQSACEISEICNDNSSDISSNSGSSEVLPPKVLTHSQISNTVDVARGKNLTHLEDDNFDDFSYEKVVEDDYNSYNFTESYKAKVGQYIVALRASRTSTESYRHPKFKPVISEHHLITEAPHHLKMCKKEKISHMLKQTIKLFNDRIMQGDDMEESELHYKELLLDHGAYLLFNIGKGYVCAAGVLDNGFKFGSTPWSKIDVIAVCKFGNGYGRLLMKHMVDAAEGQTIFVYAVTDRNVITLEKSNNGKDTTNGINIKDTIPFYEKIGFVVNRKFHQDHAEHIPPGTVPMTATKICLQNSLKLVMNDDITFLKFFILIYIHFIQ